MKYLPGIDNNNNKKYGLILTSFIKTDYINLENI